MLEFLLENNFVKPLFYLRKDKIWAIGQKVLIKIAIHIDNSMSVAI